MQPMQGRSPGVLNSSCIIAIVINRKKVPLVFCCVVARILAYFTAALAIITRACASQIMSGKVWIGITKSLQNTSRLGGGGEGSHMLWLLGGSRPFAFRVYFL